MIAASESESPRHPQDVEPRHVGEACLRLETNAVDGGHRLAVRRHEHGREILVRLFVIALVRPVEHLERAGHVEQIDAFVDGNPRVSP
jgi:hypothetical protein